MQNNPNSKFQIPNSCKKIFLVGMPGVGKTYWGRKLAEHYKLAFEDLDLYIEKQEEYSIAELFAAYGEAGFRERESKYLQLLISGAGSDMIIACGGGTPCFNDNMNVLKSAGIVIYLQANVSLLMDHIANDDRERPLLKDKPDVAEYLNKLLVQREEIYRQAHYILHTEDISLITFDKIITSCINRH